MEIYAMCKDFLISDSHTVFQLLKMPPKQLDLYIMGKEPGSLRTFGTFCNHGTETMTTGEGGMFVTKDAYLYDKVLTLSNHGRSRLQSKQFWPDIVGYKYKMSDIQAAIGCAQLERVHELVGKKRQILSYYKSQLCRFDRVVMNPESGACTNGAWMPTIVFDRTLGISRKRLQDLFKKQNVDARVFFWPLSSQDMFEKANNPVSYDIPERAINLPSYHDLTLDDQNIIVSAITKILPAK